MRIIITNQEIHDVNTTGNVEQVKESLKEHIRRGDTVVHDNTTTGVQTSITNEEGVDSLFN